MTASGRIARRSSFRSACILALACALTLAPHLARAAAVPTPAPSGMTLHQAVAFALAHDTTVLRAVAAVSSAGAMLARDRALTLPTANGELQNQMQKSQNSGQFAQIGVAVSPTFSQNTAALTASFNGLNLTNIEQARSDKQALDQANGQLELARENTILNVETSFYTVAQDRELTVIAAENVSYNHALMQIAQVNYRAGKVAGLDQLKAQVAYTSALEALASAQADEEDARENLAQLIGAPMSTAFAIPDVVPEPPLPSLDRTALDALATANRPDLAVAQAQVTQAVIGNALVDAPNRPNVSVSGAWGNQVSPTNNAQLTNNYNACIAAGEPPSVCSPGASHFYVVSINSIWTLPLIDWGTLHAAHGNARTEIDLQTAVLESTKQQVLIDVDQAVRRLLVDRQNLQLAQSNVSVARQAAFISAAQYRAGIISQTDVTVAQTSYLNAAKDLLNAQVAYVLGIATLEKATGTLMDAV
jgi:outer membrane protein TolC